MPRSLEILLQPFKQFFFWQELKLHASFSMAKLVKPASDLIWPPGSNDLIIVEMYYFLCNY